MAIAELTTSRLEELLGEQAQDLLSHRCHTISASELHLPGPDFVDRVLLDSDRSTNRAAQAALAAQQRPPGGNRLRQHPARRPRSTSSARSASPRLRSLPAPFDLEAEVWFLSPLKLDFDARGRALLSWEGINPTSPRKFTALDVRAPGGGWTRAANLSGITWGNAQIHLYGSDRALLVAGQVSSLGRLDRARWRLVQAYGRSNGSFGS